jgi:hypothetical protein
MFLILKSLSLFYSRRYSMNAGILSFIPRLATQTIVYDHPEVKAAI